MVFPPLTWVLLTVAAALCAIGFIKFVWFMSVGYGLAVGGIGVAVFAIAVIRGDLTPVMAVLCCLLLVYGLRLGLFLLVREMKSAAYRKTLNAQTEKPVPFFVKIFMWIFMAVLYVMEASAIWYREATAPDGPQLWARRSATWRQGRLPPPCWNLDLVPWGEEILMVLRVDRSPGVSPDDVESPRN